jgi:hypothetical protein
MSRAKRVIPGVLASVVTASCVLSLPARAVAEVGRSQPEVILAPGSVVEANGAVVQASATVPSDGRLRGADFTATVTTVSWPQSATVAAGVGYVAGTGRRLVNFTLKVTQPADDSGLLNASTAVTGALEIGTTSLPLSMTRIDQQINGGTSGSAETTGTDSFVASVPARDHDVDAALTEAGFTQSLNLWTLERVMPGPAVLYRDPSFSTVTGSASAAFHLAFDNPADGFTSSDDASVQSATLTWFAPDGSGANQVTPLTPTSSSDSSPHIPIPLMAKATGATTSRASRRCPPTCSALPRRTATR